MREGLTDVCVIRIDSMSRTLLLKKCKVRNLALAKLIEMVCGNGQCI